jgi:glyoxylase-like metal-dependent hydrolase (beta-lactamase superfamily II)
MAENVYTVNELKKGFYSIEENGVRMFLIEGNKRSMLIDTGYGSGDLKAIVESITSLPVFVLMTHPDRDHIGCNEQFEEIWMHPADFAMYYEKCQYLPIPAPVWEGTSIDLGTYQFEILFIPGHTPGSIALLDRKNKLLIPGDSIQKGPIYMFNPWRNMHAYIASLDKLISRIDEFDLILPSHNQMPFEKEKIYTLKAGAEKLLNGELKGEEISLPYDCKHYFYKDISFYY